MVVYLLSNYDEVVDKVFGDVVDTFQPTSTEPVELFTEVDSISSTLVGTGETSWGPANVDLTIQYAVNVHLREVMLSERVLCQLKVLTEH